MGVTLHLGFDSSVAGDTKHGGESFMAEIINPSYPNYFNLDAFLTREEQQLLRPDFDRYDELVDKYRHIDAAKLKSVFIKVYNHLRDNHEKFPLTHMISEDDIDYASTSNRFDYRGRECYLDGFHNNYSHRTDLCLMCWQDGWQPFEWIKVSRKLVVKDKVFYIQTSNKFEQYKDILQELIDICDEGVKGNRKLIWVFST